MMHRFICCFLMRTSHHAEIEYFLRPYCAANQESQISQMPLSSSGMLSQRLRGEEKNTMPVIPVCSSTGRWMKNNYFKMEFLEHAKLT